MVVWAMVVVAVVGRLSERKELMHMEKKNKSVQ